MTVVGRDPGPQLYRKDNEPRTLLEVTAADIGLSLKFTPAHAARATQDLADAGHDGEDEAPF